MTFLNLLFVLIFCHFLADYPLQGDFLARAKNRTAPIPGVPWWQALLAHAFIHGGFVALATGSIVLGLGEVACHAVIDDGKCRGVIGFNEDQLAHLICKVFWALVTVYSFAQLTWWVR